MTTDRHGQTRTDGNTGMTLLEVLVAMVIVSIGVITVLQSQAASHRLVSRTRANERLAILSEGIMEKTIALGKMPSTGRLAGNLPSPNSDVGWAAEFNRVKWNDTSVLVRIDLTVSSRDGAIQLNTERYWP